MITIKIVTELVPGGENETETYDAKRRADGDWYVKPVDETEWPDEPYADADASRYTVAQLLRKEHSSLY